MREIFKPIEAVLPKGDTLDYDRTVLFSGLPNNTNEHIVIVPVSSSSVSVQKAQRLGKDLTWMINDWFLFIGNAAYHVKPLCVIITEDQAG